MITNQKELLKSTFRKFTTTITLVGAIFLFAAATQASTYVVTNTNNSGPGSLRAKITAANADPFSLINFNIPGGGVHTIMLTSPLPAITQAVTINGYSQPGASPNTQMDGSNALLLIELNGANAGVADGLTINVGGCVIRGLVINRFSAGILINGSGGQKTTITGCFIGTNAAGNVAAPNVHGIELIASSNNTIGGSVLSSRNLISGNSGDGIRITSQPVGVNAKNNLIAGNLIGTDKSGTGAIGNGDGISLEHLTGPNTIGAVPPLPRNVISGNQTDGISLRDADETLVIGNYIGTNAAGTGKVGNTYGVSLEELAFSNKIGNIGSGNLISGNAKNGINIGNGGPFNNQVLANLIGTRADGTTALGNAFYGVALTNGTLNSIGGTVSGSGNVIAFNSGGIAFGGGTGNAIRQNSIFSNTTMGIDLIPNGSGNVSPNDLNDPDTGPNNLQNYPVIASAVSQNGITTLGGTLNSESNKSYRIEFFANSQCDNSGYGEGQSFLGALNVVTSGNNAGFNVSFPGFNLNQFITATATDPDGNTSEFSQCTQVTPPLPGSLQFNAASTYIVNEGDGEITINVTRTNGSAGAVTVHYATANGTATAGSDYTAVAGTLQFGDGVTSQSFKVPVTDDPVWEGTETVTLTLSNPTGGALLGNPVSVVMSINNDDPDPTVSIADVSVAEGNGGATPANLMVSLSNASSQSITVDFASVAGGTATLGNDYQSASGTLTFAPGETSKAATVLVNGDAQEEPNETFVVQLSNVTYAQLGKAQGTGTIINDDAPAGPAFQFSQASYSVAEGLSAVTVIITRSGNTSGPASVDYTTSDETATQKSDYEIALGTVSFAPGETSKSVLVLLNSDMYIEGNESFKVVLSNPSGAALGQPVTTVNITDDVPESASNPIDDAQAFVHTHYHDFLNREPDAAGLAFWTNQITSCGNDAQCIEVKRINVSAAYFLSIEFQQTGYLLYLFQKESFGSIPKYNSFMRDLQEVSQGVVVNSPGWEQKLAANQQQFAEKWVDHPAFKAAYDNMSNAAYVNALYANAGVAPPQAERDALVTALDTATQTRAAVLLEVAGNAAFRQQEQNSAFVLMQYFGYLRRDPDSAPDSDLSGYNFWLTKLNAFNGDYLQAEMVKAFLTSIEYRGRFGQ